ncbi:MAG: IS1634 family transposase [Candidatus Aminicenantes bacterium]|nr:IS1634 family transposase [Candidatus Aminicenantes bacterium]
MYIEAVPNRKSPPAVLLRESYRQDGKVKKRTLANLSKWPPELVEGFRILLKKGTAVPDFESSFDIVRSQPHGHIAALLGSLRKIGLDRCLGPPGPQRDLVVALIVARLAHPRSKLATARSLQAATRTDSLAPLLGLPDLDENRLDDAMDWLLQRQDAIEKRLARRHLKEGSLVLYDLTSVYLEGRRCKLGKLGYSRDGKRGKLQIEFGLICNREGCPVAVQVFKGNTSDPATVGPVIEKLRHRFGLSRVILVGDRGMLTQARIREEVQPSGLDWISALRGPAIRQLVESGAVQMSLFDEINLVEIRSDAYPDERLMVCRNPLLARQRTRKRQEMLSKTEELLDEIVAATRRDRRPYRGRERIALRVGKVVNKYKMAKHFELDITEESFTYERNNESIAAEAALDGLYVIRTSLPAEEMGAEATVRAYKGLSVVEQAFRSYKTVDLKVRPIYHWSNDRVRAHVFLCLLVYYVEWHMRRRLAPLLFDDSDPAGASRSSVVAPAEVSRAAQQKARSKRTADGQPVHSFRTLLEDLATIVRNQVVPKIPGARPFTIVTRPTPLQQQALDRLGVRL